MPTLKEIKGRISSVQSTLKITSAMKLVSSAKLRKAQTAIEAMRPYQQKLQEILDLAAGSATGLAAGLAAPSTDSAKNVDMNPVSASSSTKSAQNVDGGTVIVAIASNSSLCGGFNANAIGKVREVLKEYPGAGVISVGRKMADAMRKAGYPSPADYSALSEHPSYGAVSSMVDGFIADGRRVILVYNHFVSTAKQVPVAEVLMDGAVAAYAGARPVIAGAGPVIAGASSVILSGSEESASATESPDVIIEPSRPELLAALYPKSLKIKLFAALLDSSAAEHAARTVAMQTATDNGEDLLSELTLQYNKGRQQKITAEILDLAGGQERE